MELNRETKHTVEVGDVLRFSHDAYVVVRVIKASDRTRSGAAVSFTIQDVESKRTIYAYPSSKLYGAEIIKAEGGGNQ